MLFASGTASQGSSRLAQQVYYYQERLQADLRQATGLCSSRRPDGEQVRDQTRQVVNLSIKPSQPQQRLISGSQRYLGEAQ